MTKINMGHAGLSIRGILSSWEFLMAMFPVVIALTIATILASDRVAVAMGGGLAVSLFSIATDILAIGGMITYSSFFARTWVE